METKLYIALDYLHLEEAIFSAEQFAGDKVIGISLENILIKSSGLNIIKIFKERFPNNSIMADLKVVDLQTDQIKEIKEKGADGITVFGGISQKNWEVCLQEAKENSMKIFLDFRGCPVSLLLDNIKMADNADCIIIEMDTDIKKTVTLLHQISSIVNAPVMISNINNVDDAKQIISSGANIINISYQNIKDNNLKENIKQIQKEFLNLKDTKSLTEYNERILKEKLKQINTVQISHVYKNSVFIENVHPLQRFTKIIGKAATIRVWSGAQKAVAQFLLKIPAETILIIEASGGNLPVWGALTTELALKRKILGVVVNGAITEIDFIRNKNFPCYTTYITPECKTQEYNGLENVPLQLGKTSIQPGDWIIGDDNGVISLPANKVYNIAQQASQHIDYKEKLMDKIVQENDEEEIKDLINQYYDSHQKFMVI